jgi:two-component system, NarL family, sensor histidine kinase LiaS
MAFYRIAQEALHNTRKHSNASQINVSLVREKTCVELIIEDNGTGFDVQSTAGGHFGLKNMQQRAEAVGATLDIYSQINQGTRIRVMKENP